LVLFVVYTEKAVFFDAQVGAEGDGLQKEKEATMAETPSKSERGPQAWVPTDLGGQ
jgi:hypothetical protein